MFLRSELLFIPSVPCFVVFFPVLNHHPSHSGFFVVCSQAHKGMWALPVCPHLTLCLPCLLLMYEWSICPHCSITGLFHTTKYVLAFVGFISCLTSMSASRIWKLCVCVYKYICYFYLLNFKCIFKLMFFCVWSRISICFFDLKKTQPWHSFPTSSLPPSPQLPHWNHLGFEF